MKKIWQNFSILFLTIVILFCVLEISFRLHRWLRHHENPLAKLGDQIKDPLLGWEETKIFADPASKKTKIFFVGDSFTALWGNRKKENMYYSFVKRNLGIEMFVHGGGGYGTLQEYLAIDKYLDVIQPDLVVLQVTSNDFINNLWKLERLSYVHNNYMLRPYYENGKIVYRFPRGAYFVRKYILPYSYFIYFLVSRIDRLMAELTSHGVVNSIETQIEAKGTNLASFQESVNVTSELVAKIKKRCGQIPIVAFPVFDNEPYFSQFKAIFKKNAIDFIAEMPEVAWKVELQGRPTLIIRDIGHWTKMGHRACGDYLAKFLKNKISKQNYSVQK